MKKLLPHLNQTNFPALWLIFQFIVGGTRDKRRLAVKKYAGQKKVLEIGCSVGNVSEAFSDFEDLQFTGIDIDENALIYARKLFAKKSNFTFRNISLSDLAKQGEVFDYVLFANILHHVDDKVAVELLKDVQKLLGNASTLVIMEPEKARLDYNFVFRFFYQLEKGEYRRDENHLLALIKESGLEVVSNEGVLVSPNSMPFLKVGRITFIEASKQNL